jgi:putative tricarboxylic transport membrane protein
MHIPDRLMGTLLVGLGGIAAYAGSRFPPVPGQQIGPSVFPMVVGIGLALCGLLIALGVGRVLEEEAEADFAAHGGEAQTEQPTAHWWGGLRALVPPALLLFYVLAIDRLGFVPTAGIMIFIAAITLRASLKLALPLALIAPIGVHLVFYKLLRVPLPAGLVPLPW